MIRRREPGSLMHALGVDGGSSKTRACVLDSEGRVVGLSRGPGSGSGRLGFRSAKRVWGNVAYIAVVDAGLDTEVEGACWALAGRSMGDGSAPLHRLVTQLGLAKRNLVQTDVAAVMSAGLPRDWGVGVVCDDGLRACARTSEGREQLLPGHESPAGPWTDSHAIGREILQLALRSHRGLEPPSLLAERVPTALGVDSFDKMSNRQLARRFDEMGTQAHLAALLCECAHEGDELASGLTRRIGINIGTAVVDLIHRSGMETLDVDITFGGSLLEGAPPLLIESIKAIVQPAVPKAHLAASEFPLVIGAAFGALREIGIEVNEHVRAHARATFSKERW